MLYLLDTDHFSLVFRQGAEGERIQSRLNLVAPDDYGISIITYAEQTKGWLAEAARARTPAQEVLAFLEMNEGLRFSVSFAIWDYIPKAATRCAELRRSVKGVGTQDLRIASIALANDATVLTCNTTHFAKVPGLRFEDWTV